MFVWIGRRPLAEDLSHLVADRARQIAQSGAVPRASAPWLSLAKRSELVCGCTEGERSPPCNKRRQILESMAILISLRCGWLSSGRRRPRRREFGLQGKHKIAGTVLRVGDIDILEIPGRSQIRIEIGNSVQRRTHAVHREDRVVLIKIG